MSTELSPLDQGLLEAVSRVDVMDVAGRIVASPRRAMVSLADQLALAMAIERLQAIAIEADLLVRALALPERGREAADLRAYAVETQAALVAALLDEAREQTNTETNNRET